MLHWYMNNPEYRVYEPPEHEKTPPVDVSNDNIYNTVDDDSSTLIGTISSDLTRSCSGSRRRTRTRLVRSHQQLCSSSSTPTIKFLPNNILSTNISGVENSNTRDKITQKKETVYIN